MKIMKNLMTQCLSATTLSKTLTHSARKLIFTTLIGSATFFASALVQAAQTTIPVDLTGANATKHEIAVLQVLSEVCPPMLNRQQQTNFRRTYNNQLKQMLPSIKNPKAAIQYLSTQQDYKAILSSMRDWTLSYSRDENLALCKDLANTRF